MDLSHYADVTYPLHKASREGRDEVLLALLRSGQHQVNGGSFDLVRPLHEASLQGHFQCVRILLDFGAQVNIRNIDGSTPLCDACSRGNVDIVNLLLQHGAHVNPPLTLSSPVHEAVLYNRWECVEVLLAHHANPNTSDCHYGTPLHIAACRGHHKCAEVLLRYGANVNATHIHASALHSSAKRQDELMVHLLLEHGADVYAEDNQGRTARDLVPDRADKAEALKKKPQESEPLLPPVGAASHRQQRTAALAEPDTSSATGCQRLSPVPASEVSDTHVTLLDTFMVLHVFSVLPEGLWWLWGCPRNFRPATDFFGVNILCIFSVVLGDCSLILIGPVLSPNK